MIIIYNSNDGRIQNVLWDKDKSLAFGTYLEIDELVINQTLLFDLYRCSQLGFFEQYHVLNGKLYKDVNEVIYSSDIDKAQLKSAYQAMIDRLDQIQSVGSPTNAQVIQAVKDEALYIERIMKVIKTLLV